MSFKNLVGFNAEWESLSCPCSHNFSNTVEFFFFLSEAVKFTTNPVPFHIFHLVHCDQLLAPVDLPTECSQTRKKMFDLFLLESRFANNNQ